MSCVRLRRIYDLATTSPGTTNDQLREILKREHQTNSAVNTARAEAEDATLHAIYADIKSDQALDRLAIHEAKKEKEKTVEKPFFVSTKKMKTVAEPFPVNIQTEATSSSNKGGSITCSVALTSSEAVAQTSSDVAEQTSNASLTRFPESAKSKSNNELAKKVLWSGLSAAASGYLAFNCISKKPHTVLMIAMSGAVLGARLYGNFFKAPSKKTFHSSKNIIPSQTTNYTIS